MIKDITGRQAIILMAIVMCATKFFVLPSNLLTTGHQTVIYVMLLFFVVEFLLLLVMVRVSMLHPDKTFYELLCDSVGVVVAKIVYVLFFVFFIFKLCINIIETYTFFLGTLYDELSSVLYLLPIILLAFYMTYIGLRSIGRSAELLWVFVFLGLAVALIASIPNADFGYMLPIFDGEVDNAISVLSSNSFWFGDYLVYLFFFGKIKFQKNYFTKFAIVCGIVMAVIVLFMAVVYCIFPYTMGMVRYGVSDITHITAHITNIGNLDWLNTTLWTFASIIQTVIFAYCAERCLSAVFNIKYKYISSSISLLILTAVLFILNFRLTTLIAFVQSPVRFLLPILLFVALNIITVHFICRSKQKKQNRMRGIIYD